MKESDLYPTIKQFLEAQAYEVKAEVHDCDVLAVRGDEPPVVVELKLSINLTVLLQAVDRLTLTDKVYIGVPNKRGILDRKRKQVIKLLRMLGMGLIVINPRQKTADVWLDPGEYRPRKSKARTQRLLGEFHKRVGDPNQGGSTKRKGIMTAYRQRALAVARYLEQAGPTKAAVVPREVADPKARDILYRDVYGWFERVSTGVYQLTPKGESEIELW